MDQAKAYCEAGSGRSKNLKFDAMCPCFTKDKKIVIDVDYIKDILIAINWAEKYGIDLVLAGASDAHHIADELVKKNIAVILRPVHSLPLKAHDDIDLPFRMASILEEAGVTYCLSTPDFSGDTRNLPFHAGTAVGHGLSEENAVKAITGNAAKVLGIDDRLGTIEEGKDATLIISEGNILDVKSHNIIHAFIDGRKVNLGNKQKDLYKKFMKKYEKEDQIKF